MSAKLFRAASINTMELANRLVRSATGEGAATREGRCADTMVRFYDRLASGGVGLIISGHAYVRQDGTCGAEMTGVYKDDLVPDLRRMADAVHRHSAKIVMQINHGGRQTPPELIDGPPVAPSAVTDPSVDVTPRALAADEIDPLIEAFVQAARRVKAAGFDGVQIHSAHGYLISQFSSPYTNRRTDQWGGSLENRARFVTETFRRVRAEVGDDYPILIKLNADDFIEGGIGIEESSEIAKMLGELGIDAIEISGAMRESVDMVMRKGVMTPEDEAYFRPFAEAFREKTCVPLILTGGVRSVEVSEELLESGVTDFVGMCRPFIREPDLPNRWKSGDTRRATCVSCGKCKSSPETANVCGLEE